EPARTPWTAGTARTFPELVLRPRAEPGLADVEGSILDRAGRPVAGAAVWTVNETGTPSRTVADAGGRFHLSGIPPRPTFLFVGAAGSRFSGRVIAPAAGRISIAPPRPDEPSPIRMRTLPTARPRAEERALARRVLLPHAERAVKDGD